jgi:glutaredoxin
VTSLLLEYNEEETLMKNIENANVGCCSCGSGCCGGDSPKQANNKSVVIDFLYLDLSVCEWCKGTDKSLEEALKDVSNVLQASGIEVVVNKINVTSEELAIKHKFITSPTIRVNGRDIQMEVKESLCDSCGDLCGDNVDCRVWVYNGEEYTIPPKALIIEGILKSVYGVETVSDEEVEYELPENLRKFYAAMKVKKSCCGGTGDNKCC